MSLGLEIFVGLGCIAFYVWIGGAVYAVATRIEALHCVEPAIAVLWPVAVPVVLVAVGCCYAGGWVAGFGVRGAEAIIAWRRRPQIPRATARRKGGR